MDNELFDALIEGNIDWLSGNLEDPNTLVKEVPPGSVHFGKLPIPCLSIVILRENLECVQYLVEAGADTNQPDKCGYTPAHYAAYMSNCDILEYLWENDCDFTKQATNGCLSIHVAARFGIPECVQWLADHDVNVNACDCDMNTPLLSACGSNNPDIISCLIDSGADPMARDVHGNTAIHIALKRKQTEVAYFLMSLEIISWDAVNYRGVTFLMIAAKQGDIDLVSFLADQNADPKLKTSIGRTVLHYAIKHNNIEIVRMLLSLEVVDPTIHDKFGYSALHMAAMTRNVEMIQVVAEYDSENLNNNDCGYTPLHLAIRKNQYDCISCIASMPEIDLMVDNWCHQTVLHLAAIFSSVDVFDSLFETQELDIDMVDNIGFTSLHYAVMHGSLELVEYILDKGAYIMALTDDGRSVFDIARKRGHKRIIELLEEHRPAPDPEDDSHEEEM